MLDRLKLETIFKYYGLDSQLRKLEEEITELKKEIFYFYEKDKISNNILEEMADVLHLILQFMTVPECKEKIEKMLKFKNDRQLRRIHTEIDKKNEVV